MFVSINLFNSILYVLYYHLPKQNKQQFSESFKFKCINFSFNQS